ncbi:MAG: rhomboid family intramembrane serine protease [Candidatus Dojkabacteria bacterium]
MRFKLTYALMAVNIVLFLLTILLTTTLNAFPNDVLRFLGAEFFPDIIAGQVWRLILPAFLHGGLIHLLINMWALWNVGIHIENFYGRRKLFLIYILTGLTASLLSVAVTFFGLFTSGSTGQGFAVSIGSSGAIFGLVGILLGNNYKRDTFTPPVPINTSGLWIFVIVNLMFGLGINSLGGTVGVNNAAHIGGLIGGFLLGLYLNPINAYFVSKRKQFVESALFFASVALLAASFIAHIIFIIT